MILARSAMSKNDDRYQPTIVMGWAMENDRRRAMFNSREKLAMIARPSETPLTAKSLNAVLAFKETLHRESPLFSGSLEKVGI